MIAQASASGGDGGRCSARTTSTPLPPLFDLQPTRSCRPDRRPAAASGGGKRPIGDRRMRRFGVEIGPAGQALIYDRLEEYGGDDRVNLRARASAAALAKTAAFGARYRLSPDGGAYMTLSPVVLSRGARTPAALPGCPERLRLGPAPPRPTSHRTVPSAVRRLQSVFAIERHMDRAARDPICPRFGAAVTFRTGRDHRHRAGFIRDGVDLTRRRQAPDLADYFPLRQALAEEKLRRRRRCRQPAAPRYRLRRIHAWGRFTGWGALPRVGGRGRRDSRGNGAGAGVQHRDGKVPTPSPPRSRRTSSASCRRISLSSAPTPRRSPTAADGRPRTTMIVGEPGRQRPPPFVRLRDRLLGDPTAVRVCRGLRRTPPPHRSAAGGEPVPAAAGHQLGRQALPRRRLPDPSPGLPVWRVARVQVDLNTYETGRGTFVAVQEVGRVVPI